MCLQSPIRHTPDQLASRARDESQPGEVRNEAARCLEVLLNQTARRVANRHFQARNSELIADMVSHVWAQLGHWRQEQPFAAWCYQVMRNHCISLWRSRDRQNKALENLRVQSIRPLSPSLETDLDWQAPFSPADLDRVQQWRPLRARCAVLALGLLWHKVPGQEWEDWLTQQLRQDVPTFAPSHVVTVVSRVRSVVALGVAASGASKCLLLYEKNPREKAIPEHLKAVEAFLTQRGIECTPADIELVDRAHDQERIEAHVRAFVQGQPTEKVAFDLTPGYKSISLALDELAPQGSWLLYCRHRQMPPDNRVLPHSERYDCWAKSEFPALH